MMDKFDKDSLYNDFGPGSDEDFAGCYRGGRPEKKTGISMYILVFFALNSVISALLLSFAFYYFGPEKLSIIGQHIFSGDILSPINSEQLHGQMIEIQERDHLIKSYLNIIKNLETKLKAIESQGGSHIDILEAYDVNAYDHKIQSLEQQIEMLVNNMIRCQGTTVDTIYKDADGVWRNH